MAKHGKYMPEPFTGGITKYGIEKHDPHQIGGGGMWRWLLDKIFRGGGNQWDWPIGWPIFGGTVDDECMGGWTGP